MDTLEEFTFQIKKCEYLAILQRPQNKRGKTRPIVAKSYIQIHIISLSRMET